MADSTRTAYVPVEERAQTKKEKDRKARKKWTQESLDRKAMFDEMRKLLPIAQSGQDVRTIRKSNGQLLNFAERSVLIRLLPTPDYIKTGRMTATVNGQIQELAYHCPFNLAGRFHIVTIDGYVVNVPFESYSGDCGHSACSHRQFLRVGGQTDDIVMVLPQRYAEFPKGILSDRGIGSARAWVGAYRVAVFAVHLTKANVTFPKFRALLGHKFVPKSLFGEVCVFLARMFGLQDVGFFQYSDKSSLMNALNSATPGSSDEFTAHMNETFGQISERMSNYAWGLHHLCQLQTLAAGPGIPFMVFLKHMNKMSRETTRAFQLALIGGRGDVSHVVGLKNVPCVDVGVARAAVDAQLDELNRFDRQAEKQSTVQTDDDASQVFENLTKRDRTTALFTLKLMRLVVDTVDLDQLHDYYQSLGRHGEPLIIDFARFRDDIAFSRLRNLSLPDLDAG